VVLGQEPTGDAVEPQAPVVPGRQVVAPPPGDQVHLGQEIRGVLGDRPPGQVGQQRRAGVAEQGLEFRLLGAHRVPA
jgi:hypothetical protein